MTRTGPAKSGDPAFGRRRLELARSFLAAARAAAAADGETANPVVSLVVSSAIAYADALTAKLAGQVNRKDHRAAAKSLRDALGNRLPEAQERRLRQILAEKDEARYGARIKRREEGQRLLDELEELARWAEACSTARFDRLSIASTRPL